MNIVVISMKIYWKSGRELTDLEEGAIAENDGVVFWRLAKAIVTAVAVDWFADSAQLK